MNETSEKKVIGLLRRIHPARLWVNLKAFLLGKRGYGRIVIVDKNYRLHDHIIKLQEGVKIGGERHILDPKCVVTDKDNLSTYYFHQGEATPIDMRGSASSVDSVYLNYLIEKSRLSGLVSGMKDLQFMKMLLIILCVVCGGILYFVYQLVEAGL